MENHFFTSCFQEKECFETTQVSNEKITPKNDIINIYNMHR